MTRSEPLARGRLQVTEEDAAIRVILGGMLGVRDLPQVDQILCGLTGERPVRIDLSQVDRIDTAVAWSIVSAQQRILEAGGVCEITGAAASVAGIIETVEGAIPTPEPPPKGLPWPVGVLSRIGENVVETGRQLSGFSGVFGLFLVRLVQSVARPREFRLAALVHHCEAVGLQAVPIVSLMAFLIGIVLAFQGAAQLRQFGAEVFVVDLISLSILRELGILLTAIIVAGRTASAFTAAIGSMKMREEIDAMRTLGIDPGHALIVPRVLALVLMLPILGLIANVAGLFGGALMSWLELGISPAMFTTRMIEGTEFSNVFVGVVKAPVFAILIGVIGCQAGLNVGKTAESLGRMTSAAVVGAIFAVILADAVFSIFFEQMGL